MPAAFVSTPFGSFVSCPSPRPGLSTRGCWPFCAWPCSITVSAAIAMETKSAFLTWPSRRRVSESRRDRRFDRQQVDVEHQHAARLAALAFVGRLLGNPEARALALDHQLQAFGPPADHVIQVESD